MNPIAARASPLKLVVILVNVLAAIQFLVGLLKFQSVVVVVDWV